MSETTPFQFGDRVRSNDSLARSMRDAGGTGCGVLLKIGTPGYFNSLIRYEGDHLAERCADLSVCERMAPRVVAAEGGTK